MTEKKSRQETEKAQERVAPLGSAIPADTIVLKSFDEWALYFSEKERAFYIKTLASHAEPLRLPLEDLYGMLADIEKIMKEKKEDNLPRREDA